MPLSMLLFTFFLSLVGAVSGLAAPQNLQVTGTGLLWNSVPSADGYNIYRDNSYIDTVTAGRSYSTDVPGTYYVTAFSPPPRVYSGRSNEVTIGDGGGGGDGSVAAPTNLRKWRRGLRWDSVGNPSGYNIYQNDEYIATVEGQSYRTTLKGSFYVTAYLHQAGGNTVYSSKSNLLVLMGETETLLNENFSGGTLSADWLTPSWTSFRDATNTRSQCKLNRGVLNLQARIVRGNIRSCYMIHKDKVGPGTDGTIDFKVRANVARTRAHGIWFAAWLFTLGKDSNDVDYAYDRNLATGTEIDVVEYIPFEKSDGTFSTLNWIHPAVHAGQGDSAFVEGPLADGYVDPGVELTSGYHIFGLQWNYACQVFTVDGKIVWINKDFVSSAETHQPILSLEVQDAWGFEDVGNIKRNIRRNPSVSKVDWLRITKQEGVDLTICDQDY